MTNRKGHPMDHATIRSTLERTLAALERRLRGEPIVREDGPQDEVDTMAAITDRETDLASREVIRARALRYREALDRLREGTYGQCVECEEPIAPARLSALPEASCCVTCQARLERAAAIRRARPWLPEEDPVAA